MMKVMLISPYNLTYHSVINLKHYSFRNTKSPLLGADSVTLRLLVPSVWGEGEAAMFRHQFASLSSRIRFLG